MWCRVVQWRVVSLFASAHGACGFSALYVGRYQYWYRCVCPAEFGGRTPHGAPQGGKCGGVCMRVCAPSDYRQIRAAVHRGRWAAGQLQPRGEARGRGGEGTAGCGARGAGCGERGTGNGALGAGTRGRRARALRRRRRASERYPSGGRGARGPRFVSAPLPRRRGCERCSGLTCRGGDGRGCARSTCRLLGAPMETWGLVCSAPRCDRLGNESGHSPDGDAMNTRPEYYKPTRVYLYFQSVSKTVVTAHEITTLLCP